MCVCAGIERERERAPPPPFSRGERDSVLRDKRQHIDGGARSTLRESSDTPRRVSHLYVFFLCLFPRELPGRLVFRRMRILSRRASAPRRAVDRALLSFESQESHHVRLTATRELVPQRLPLRVGHLLGLVEVQSAPAFPTDGVDSRFLSTVRFQWPIRTIESSNDSHGPWLSRTLSIALARHHLNHSKKTKEFEIVARRWRRADPAPRP